MSTLREAAQQALEALEAMNPYPASKEDQRAGALTALRAALAQQAEPLNLRDPAVQKRLATQWGYVPAAQAEPVEPVATLIAQCDALLEALKTYGWHTEDCPQYPTHARPKNWPACTCGFDAAIKAVKEGK